ncbi:hypothetical protein ACQPXT_40285 [Streptomyces sp. CA-100214]
MTGMTPPPEATVLTPARIHSGGPPSGQFHLERRWQKRRFAESLAVIDQALELLPPGDPSVHDDLVWEHALPLMAAMPARRPAPHPKSKSAAEWRF